MADQIIRFIGDVHGKFDAYTQLIEGCPRSIQVGDFGVGFGGHPDSPLAAMKAGNHRFIRGNHDNPNVCKRNNLWIADGTEHEGIFCVGGALSIDKAYRIEGLNWWADEELSQQEFDRILTAYEEAKPSVVVTHDCPRMIALAAFPRMIPVPSITRQGLDAMFNIHTPKLWVFGHWHTPAHFTAMGCEFICLPELATVDIDMREYR